MLKLETTVERRPISAARSQSSKHCGISPEEHSAPTSHEPAIRSEVDRDAFCRTDGALRLLRWAVWLGAAGLSILTACLILSRFSVNFDHEWVESTVIRSVGEILAGRSMYPTPTAEFLGDGYPPFFHYVCAGFALFWGEPLLVGRVLSIVATILAVFVLYAASRQPLPLDRAGGVSASTRLIVPMLFLGFFAAGGQTYDLARIDMLAMAFSICGAWVATRSDAIRAAVLAGLFMSCAIMTKHNMTAIAGAICVALMLVNVRRAILFGMCALLPAIAFFVALHVATDGWAGFLLFSQLAANEFGGRQRWMRFIAHDLSWHGPLMLVIIAAMVMAIWRADDTPRCEGRRRVVGLIVMAAGGLAMTISGRLKIGGYPNNLVPAWMFALFACASMLPRVAAAFPALPASSRRMWKWMGHALLGGIVLSLGMTFTELPLRKYFGVGDRKAAVAELQALIDEHAASGPVWLPAHAGVLPNAIGYAHLCPAGFMIDADGFPIKSIFTADVIRRLDRQEWSAIILDNPRDHFISQPIWESLITNYREAPWPLGDPDRLVSLSGKITAPRRLFIRRERPIPRDAIGH